MRETAEIRSIVLQVGNVCRQTQFTREKQLQFNTTTKTKFNLELQGSRSKILQPHQILYPYWGIKRNNFITKVTWGILREYPPYNLSKRKCYLSLNEKLEINSYKGNNLLNKRSELIKYRIKVQASKQIYVITT